MNNVTLSKKILSLNGRDPLELALTQLAFSNANVQLSTCIAADQDRLRQRFGYLAFVHSIGMQYESPSWFGSDDECGWTGISCDANNTVTKLQLPQRNFIGTIPADVGLLTGLTNFFVAFNQLGGKLPTTIGLLTRLSRFSVGNNQLTGTVPTEVSKWTSINQAYFSSNKLTGAMPLFKNFCPFYTVTGELWADCAAPEIKCDCCNRCF
jgi:Leucine-rich repeat (LRR) protein